MNKLILLTKKHGAYLVLIVVVFLHYYLVSTQNLTSWKGGGFCMFCTVDSTAARLLRISLIIDGTRYPVEVPNHLNELAIRVRAAPTEEEVNRLGRLLVQTTWVPYDYVPYLPEGGLPHLDESDASSPKYRALSYWETSSIVQPIVFEGVSVELWRYTFDSRKQELRAVKWFGSYVKSSR